MSKGKSSRQSQQYLPFLLIAAGVLLIAVVVIWQIAGTQINGSGTGSPVSKATLTTEEIPRISVAEAKKALDDKQAIFVDVRSRDAYAVEHITGAINIPFDEISNLPSSLQPAQWIITYCT